jgi:hypothetical protein
VVAKTPEGEELMRQLSRRALTDKLIYTMTIFLTALIGFATLGHCCSDSVRSFAAGAKENADDEGNDVPLRYTSRRDVPPCRVTLF